MPPLKLLVFCKEMLLIAYFSYIVPSAEAGSLAGTYGSNFAARKRSVPQFAVELESNPDWQMDV